MNRFVLSTTLAMLAILPSLSVRGQTAPVQNGISNGEYSNVDIAEKWGVKIYSNRLLDISPREFGRCTPDPLRPLVYCGASDGVVRTLHKDNGQEIWSMKTSGGMRAAPAVSDKGLFVATTDGFLYRLEPETGAPIWKEPYKTDNPVWGSPIVVGDLVYFTVLGNQTYAVGVDDGRFRFKVARDKPSDMSSEGVSEPAISGGTLFSAFSDGRLVATSTTHDEKVWEQDIAGGSDGPTDADATPVVVGDMVFSGAFSAGPVAVRADDGTIVWKGRRFGVAKPVAYRDMIIVADADGYVAAMKQSDGREVWVTKLDTKAAWCPVLIDGYLVVGGDRGLWVLRASDGTPMLLKTMPFGVTAEPGVDGRDIYFVAPGGTINAATLRIPE